MVIELRKRKELEDRSIGTTSTLSLASWGTVQGLAESLAWYPQLGVPDGRWLVDILSAQGTQEVL